MLDKLSNSLTTSIASVLPINRTCALLLVVIPNSTVKNNVITEGEYARFVNATNNKWKRNPVPDDFYFVIDEDNSCMGPNDEGLDTC